MQRRRRGVFVIQIINDRDIWNLEIELDGEHVNGVYIHLEMFRYVKRAICILGNDLNFRFWGRSL